jgi:sigma-E factor negative regulatory protein RseA
MNERIGETLSSLVDDELAAEALVSTLESLEGDPALREVWGRLHLASDAIRGEPVSARCHQIASRVRQRLATEPVVLIPRKSRRGWPVRLEPVLGYALAASAALVAVFALPPLFEDRPGPGAQLADQALPLARDALHDPAVRWSQGRPALESKLNGYLVNHQEYAPAAGMKGVLPYATFVSYEGRR